MISIQNVAITASFMTSGMMCTDHKLRELDSSDVCVLDIYSIYGNGGIELHVELCKYAEVSEKIVDFLVQQTDGSFPGVYDYEVSEPFGIWFAECLFKNGEVPTEERAKQWIANEAVTFFLQCNPLDNVAHATLYNRVMEHIK